MLFDTHTHINNEQFEGEVDEVVQRAYDNDVTKMAVVGYDKDTIEIALKQSEKYEGVYVIAGWHPTAAATYSEVIGERLYDILQKEKVVAMGEMGLDYHWDTAPHKVQQDVFREQIRIAKYLDMPISIHNRDATEDTYRILKEEHVEDTGGIMHSFNLGPEWVEPFLDLGMHLSFSGVVTFKNAPEVREALQLVPLDKLLIETDAPYLSPEPKRGRRNEPAYVHYIAENMARQLDAPFEKFSQQTTDNAKLLFNI